MDNIVDLSARRPRKGLLGFSRFVVETSRCVPSFDCKLCGARCKVKRDVKMRHGVASYYTGKAGKFDVFECPNVRLAWHVSLTIQAEKISKEPDYSTIVTQMLTTRVDAYIEAKLKEARPRNWLSKLWERVFGWHVRVFAYRPRIRELP